MPTLDDAGTAAAPFGSIAAEIHRHAALRPRQPALVGPAQSLSYAALDAAMDRIAAALQRDGARPGDVVAICTASLPWAAAVFLGAVRAGLAVAPLAPSVTPADFASMLADSGARWLFVDATAHAVLPAGANWPAAVRCIAIDDGDAAHRSAAGIGNKVTTDAHHKRPDRPEQNEQNQQPDLQPLGDWLLPAGATPEPVMPRPEWPLNLIYSSGTTGRPKGIVQSHAMRWSHVMRGAAYGYGPETVTLLATPLYSNTTLVVFFPTLAFGGTVILMPKFDAATYLGIAARERATHTMLVPVQYQRIMALAGFDRFDLRAFQYKFCTSAPFAAALKADILARWPGGLIEFYGMTEGGGTCILAAREHPDKLHTVGRPAPGHDIRLIDDAGAELPATATGEVVGHSPGMMTGYHRQPALTRAAEWFDASSKRFIRTGDIGRFDADGFLQLLDRKKDLIISGGFNVYPSDLEAVLLSHPDVAEAAVVGVASERWGETPVAYVALRGARPAGGHADSQAGAETETAETAETAATLLAWANARLGKTQRLAALHLVAELPRSAIGKVLKRALRDATPALPNR